MLDIVKLQKTLSYQAKDDHWLKAAVCHKSYAKEHAPMEHFEKLEFLGDAVLDLVISDLLMAEYQSDEEGNLSRKRASIVNEDRLCELANKYQLADFILLGKSERKNELQFNARILASCFEAVVGAIYRDQGYQIVFQWVESAFGEILKEAFEEHDFERDYKTRFQEAIQEKHKTTPNYKVVEAEGPDHDKIYTVEVYLNKDLWGVGRGSSKKAAAQQAAQNALEKLEE